MIHVVIVNGPPRAGKDSFVNAAIDALHRRHMSGFAFSSIDPVRHMIEINAGISLAKKTEADRKLMQAVGAALEDHSHWRTRKTVEAVEKFTAASGRSGGAIFIHVREPLIIGKLALHLRNHPFHTVFVDSDRGENITSNAADKGVLDMDYDTTIQNNGSLDDLSRAAETYVRRTILPKLR